MFSLAEAEATDLLVDLDVSLSQARTMFVLAHVAEPVRSTRSHVASGSRRLRRAGRSTSWFGSE